MAHEYVKISELEPTSSFGTTDQFVIVQNEETVKIDGAALVESLATLTNLATRSYVDAVVDSAPGTLDTLRELAAALNDDSNFGANITALINEKLPTSNFGLEFWNQLATVNTYHISEGSNLYWTQDRFDSALASKNTYHIAEGSNLYFTTQRVLDVVTPLIPTDINQLSDSNGLLGQGGGSYPTAPTFTSVTTTQLNVQNVAFTGTGAVTIASGNDLNLSAVGDVAINGEVLSDVAFSGAYADLTGKPTLFGGSYNDLIDKNGSNGSAQVALGRWAGDYRQGESSIAIGEAAARWEQGAYAIAVGKDAGQSGQGAYAIAIGTRAGEISQGAYAIAIGRNAGFNNQPAGSIIINAIGNELNGSAAGLYIDPIRNAAATTNGLFYNTTTKEVTYASVIDLTTLKSIVAASTDFADFKARVAAL